MLRKQAKKRVLEIMQEEAVLELKLKYNKGEVETLKILVNGNIHLLNALIVEIFRNNEELKYLFELALLTLKEQ
jgi:hypothetical protein